MVPRREGEGGGQRVAGPHNSREGGQEVCPGALENKAGAYVRKVCWADVPVDAGKYCRVHPLACGPAYPAWGAQSIPPVAKGAAVGAGQRFPDPSQGAGETENGETNVSLINAV